MLLSLLLFLKMDFLRLFLRPVPTVPHTNLCEYTHFILKCAGGLHNNGESDSTSLRPQRLGSHSISAMR